MLNQLKDRKESGKPKTAFKAQNSPRHVLSRRHFRDEPARDQILKLFPLTKCRISRSLRKSREVELLPMVAPAENGHPSPPEKTNLASMAGL
ncbi:hypothetical protein RvY_09357 [Ramazzottius varieornatus]|uniref:Uncharacterized protein n=1 Tax=Ramazzottius varieornatus TaxID=947166 RepID=A0A1D1VEK4_RAMVA|nr:hypothetical protein RvY_09357 [Ramazzottius varieornatus]